MCEINHSRLCHPGDYTCQQGVFSSHKGDLNTFSSFFEKSNICIPIDTEKLCFVFESWLDDAKPGNLIGQSRPAEAKTWLS